MNNSPQKYLLNGLLSVVMITASGYSLAETKKKAPLLDRNDFSIGAGLSINSVDGPVDDEVGFQFFGAYELNNVNLMEGVRSSIEAGYMDYGFDGADADGIWATFVVGGDISGSVNWLARAGFDFGDDSGLMVGAGLGAELDKRTRLRFEYVIRDELDSIQLNLVYKL